MDTKKDHPIFSNIEKNIKIVDKGDRLISFGGGEKKESIKVMLDIAEAKGWNLQTLEVSGSDEFQALVAEEVENRKPTQTQIQKPKQKPEPSYGMRM